MRGKWKMDECDGPRSSCSILSVAEVSQQKWDKSILAIITRTGLVATAAISFPLALTPTLSFANYRRLNVLNIDCRLFFSGHTTSSVSPEFRLLFSFFWPFLLSRQVYRSISFPLFFLVCRRSLTRNAFGARHTIPERILFPENTHTR